MGVTLIFAWKGSGLKARRSDKERQLQKEGWGSSLTEEQIDKCEFMERELANKHGQEKPVFIPAHLIDKLK